MQWSYSHSEKRAVRWEYWSVWTCSACGHVTEARPEGDPPAACPACLETLVIPAQAAGELSQSSPRAEAALCTSVAAKTEAAADTTPDHIAEFYRAIRNAPKPYYDDGKGIVIFCSDCRDVLPGIEPAGLLLTDPPYGMRFSAGQRAGAHGSAWTSRWTGIGIVGDEDTSARDWVLDWWGDQPALVFGSWKTTIPANVREVLVWDKVVSTGMGALDIPWRPSWEAIYVMGKGFRGRRGHGVLRFPLPTLAPERRAHPTPKPLLLIEHLLSRCPEEWLVIDPFLGSGTTLRAAKDLGRRAIGIEISEKYCRIAVERLSQAVLPFHDQEIEKGKGESQLSMLGTVWHEFTCPLDGSDLRAHADGWRCPHCDYRLNWDATHSGEGHAPTTAKVAAQARKQWGRVQSVRGEWAALPKAQP